MVVAEDGFLGLVCADLALPISSVDGLMNYSSKLPPQLVRNLNSSARNELVIEVIEKGCAKDCSKKGCLEPLLCQKAHQNLGIKCLLEKSFIRVGIKKTLLPHFRKADFTAREREILRLLLQGYPQKKIASFAGISPFTVNDHLKSIYKKMGVTSKGEALFKARGWVLD